MKLILWFILFVSTIIVGCNSKQKAEKPIEDSTKVDTVHISQKVQIPDEKTIYDSFSTNHFSFKNLSHQFDVSLDIKRFTAKNDVHDSCIVKAMLLDKRSKNLIDCLSVTSLFFYTNYYDIPSHMVSYSTGVHILKEVVDNYVGDLAVIDLNFDGRDDVALINDMGGNGGPLYSYFVQQPDRKFIMDRYLTDSISYFPGAINRKRKTLTTYVHAGACCVGKHVYQLNPSDQQWRQIEHVILGLPKRNNK
jgi:hypothetical protein